MFDQNYFLSLSDLIRRSYFQTSYKGAVGVHLFTVHGTYHLAELVEATAFTATFLFHDETKSTRALSNTTAGVPGRPITLHPVVSVRYEDIFAVHLLPEAQPEPPSDGSPADAAAIGFRIAPPKPRA